VRNLERGRRARESRPELSALKTLRGQQEDLLRKRFLEKPERGKAPERAWGRNFGKPLRRKKP
jgi:hypothetical protein